MIASHFESVWVFWGVIWVKNGFQLLESRHFVGSSIEIRMELYFTPVHCTVNKHGLESSSVKSNASFSSNIQIEAPREELIEFLLHLGYRLLGFFSDTTSALEKLVKGLVHFHTISRFPFFSILVFLNEESASGNKFKGIPTFYAFKI
ncbi:hypothetical protein JTE90_011567 [Oedothorax gibbosus]|uniref:Uncharacterized protein n=1 Tax=Oedothorax gibbosus TaxID=931172 RepID=A0AAV6UMD1_9ARAC|nr:hypothetical protein JTE90_011567 [Oedothorax gibbosus]